MNCLLCDDKLFVTDLNMGPSGITQYSTFIFCKILKFGITRLYNKKKKKRPLKKDRYTGNMKNTYKNCVDLTHSKIMTLYNTVTRQI